MKYYILALLAILSLTSCEDSKSYTELLNEETESTNAYLANQRVVKDVPADSIFETGPDAPYYRIDPEGNVYMQVINPGTKENRPANDQLIYFRFTRYNLNAWYRYDTWYGEGNANNFEYAPTSFRYGNYTLQSSAQYGAGVQLPLAYLGIDCEVNLVIKSQYGFTSEIANVTPFMYNIRYFKSQI